MLPLQRCRDLLGENGNLSDDEIRTIADQLHQLAGLFIEIATDPKITAQIYAPHAKDGKHNDSEDSLYEQEERAAILEFDGGMTRTDAEHYAQFPKDHVKNNTNFAKHE